MYDKTFTTVLDRRELLRVKLKNLAQEAALIRREENKILWVKSAGKTFHAARQALFDTPPPEGVHDRDLRTLRGLRRAMTRKVGDYGLYLDLHNHRVKHVRHHARMAHLAYGAIRGRTLEQMEGGNTLSHDQKTEVLRLYKKYGAKNAVVPEWMVPATLEPARGVLRGVAIEI